MLRADPKRVQKAERVELIRRLLIAGVPDWKIRQQLVAGVALRDGRVCKVTNSCVSKDLKLIGLEYKGLHDNALVAERVVGACAERLARIADKAEAAGQFSAAIRANLALVDLVGRRHVTRWSRRSLEPDSVQEAVGREDEYAAMTDGELVAEHQRRLARAEQLGLAVVTGGKSG